MLALAACLSLHEASAEEKPVAAKPEINIKEIDFQKKIAPILASACVRCHNDDTSKGKLSLSSAGATLKGGKKGPAVIAGDPKKSLLLKVITGPDPDMPEDGDPLSDQQVALIKRWIEQGAKWPADFVVVPPTPADESWWSLQPSRRPTVPAITGPTIRNPIDAFIQAKLREKGLTPAKAAEPRVLIRRMYFDVIGLPPTPAQVEAFVAAAAVDFDGAIARLADELLASPDYGQRWGRHWLDIAHYADTHGFERDMRRDHAWRYRDYVIDAFNSDKPYNRFLLEQIAGDVASQDGDTTADAISPEEGLIATGFLAAGPFDYVGQIETASPTLRMQARADDLDDMVTQVIASTVGLTINCARCHDHKLDPITTEDYYSLWAVFAGVKRGDRALPGDATLEKQRSEMQAKLAAVSAELSKLQGKGLDLADIIGGGDGTGNGKANTGIDPRNGKASTGKVGMIPTAGNTFIKAESRFVDGVAVPAIKAEIIISSTGLKLTDLPATTGGTWDYIQNGPTHSQHHTKIGDIDYVSDGRSILGLHANKLITFDLKAIREKHGADGSLDSLRFTGIAGNGGNGGDGAAFGIYLDGKPALPLTTIKSHEAGVPIAITRDATHRFLTLVALDGGRDISHDQIFLGDPRLISDRNAELTPAQQARLDELRTQHDSLKLALSKLPAPAAKKVFAIVPQTPPAVHILSRGDPESPVREVKPAAIKVIKTLDASLGDNATPEGNRRLALANWIIDPANPLTRRVIVNRLWHYHFGTGIVATPSDFGYAGDRPSHPQLLDWLAEEMLAQNWSLKAMHKLILTSHTYRQSSALNPEAAKIDAGNRLLWRMSPRRLEVEAVRDAVLTIAGTLNPQTGGPGFEDFTYRQEYAPVYRYITADRPALWRRTVYRYVVRTTQNEFLQVLDCSDPYVLTPARNRTTTALQALALMNNPFMVEQAGHFAARLRREAGNEIDAQIKQAFTLAFGRAPANEELTAARTLVKSHSLEAFCRMMLNANEFVYVD